MAIQRISATVATIGDREGELPCQNIGKEKELYAQMHQAARLAYRSLISFGHAVEMSLSSSSSRNVDESAMLNDDKRGKWRSIGRNIWMTV
eukprot:10622072-Ditylum_brightwellii.AAC.1